MNENTRIPVFDGHNDVSARLDGAAGGEVFFTRNAGGHLDYPRAREGGFRGGLFAIFVASPRPAGEGRPAEPAGAAPGPADFHPVDFGTAHEVTRRRIALLRGLARDGDAPVVVAGSAREIAGAMARGALAVVIHLEGAEAVEPGLENLEALYRQGVRSIGVTWSRENAFGHGVTIGATGSPDTGPGLTDAGKALVAECNRLGILVDLSHLNERGFWDVAGLSTAPLVATHSCVHALSPVPRNLTDPQIDAIGESGGLIGINFSVGFIRPDGRREPDTPLGVLADHFAYVAERIGVDHVAMGSDFDGTTIPRELGDVSGLPRLVDALRGRGFGEEELEKICWRNWLRTLAAAWKE